MIGNNLIHTTKKLSNYKIIDNLCNYTQKY